MKNGQHAGIVLLLLVAFLSSVALSCARGPALPAGSDFPIQELPKSLPDGWVQNLHRWLSLSYVEQNEMAGFVWLSPGMFEQSDLYTTCTIIDILTDLGENLDSSRRESVGDWIASKRTEEGYYVGTLDSEELPVVTTHRAVTALSRLGWSFETPENTVDYLLSLQQPEGLFIFTHDPEESYGSREEDRITASFYVVRTLKLLGFKDISRLASTESALQVYLHSQFGPHSMGPGPESGTTVLAILALSLLDPSKIIQEARNFIQRNLEEAYNLKGDFPSIAHINNVVDAAKQLGVFQLGSDSDTYHLREYLQQKVFTNQEEHGGFGYGDTLILEPQVTGTVTGLASRLGVQYPMADRLVNEISLRETSTGWSPFFRLSLRGKEEATYYGLALAQVSDFEGYDAQLVSKFFEHSLLTPGYDLRSAFFAMLGYKLLHGGSLYPLRDKVKDLSIQAASRLPIDCDHLSDFSYFAKAATESEFEIPDDLRSEVTHLAQGCRRTWLDHEGGPLMPRIHVLRALQQNLRLQNLLDEERTTELALALWKDLGGFGWRQIAYPDIHSTYQALEILGSDPPISQSLLSDFILSCVAKYGFTPTPLGQGLPDKYEQESDIWTTFEALVVLDRLD